MRVPLAAALLCGCESGAETESPDVQPLPACAPLELSLPDGSCVRPGVPPDGCGAGFVHDGEYGCDPILPTDACPPGQMAVPGESACRPVMPCGAGKWGDLSVDAQTEYVDSAYGGMDSDGSATRPWKTIGEAYAAATSGALIAVAEGSYLEDVVISDKPVRLWGVCPDKVALVGTGAESSAVYVASSFASGTEIGGLEVRGSAGGIGITGAVGVIVDRIWTHETASSGIVLESALGATSMRMNGSLVEQSRLVGLYLAGSEAVVDASVVRGTLPQASDLAFGRGINVGARCAQGLCDPNARSRFQLWGSLVEQNHDVGLFVAGADVEVEASVVRHTLPRASDQMLGQGFSVELPCTTQHGCFPTIRSTAQVRRALFEQNHNAGLRVGGSDAVVEATVVRGTLPQASDGKFGRGISIQVNCDPILDRCDPTARASATVLSSLVENNHEVGIRIAGSDAVLEATVVRRTLSQASDQLGGRGIEIQVPCWHGVCDPTAPAHATVRSSLVEENRDLGVFVGGSDATVERSILRNTLARADGLFGDGVGVTSKYAPTRATFTSALIADSARAGVSNFGAVVLLRQTRIQCAAFELSGEPYQAQRFVFEDLGENACGCPNATGPCKAVSAGLDPPEQLTPED